MSVSITKRTPYAESNLDLKLLRLGPVQIIVKMVPVRHCRPAAKTSGLEQLVASTWPAIGLWIQGSRLKIRTRLTNQALAIPRRFFRVGPCSKGFQSQR